MTVGVQIVIRRVLYNLCIFNNLLDLCLVNMVVTCCSLVAVTVSPVQITLSQIGCSSHLVGTSCLTRTSLRQVLIGKLEVVDDVLHDFVMRALRGRFDGRVVHTFCDERNLIPHLLQLVIEVGTQETSLGLILLVLSSFLDTIRCFNGTVAARNGTVKLVPKFVEFTTVWL